MRVAALFDIHANLPALEAVLQDVRRAGVDRIVVGGDIVPGPMPVETFQRLLNLDLPVHFIHGNGELAVLAQMAAPDANSATYWGTTSGRPLPEELRAGYRWVAEQLQPEYEGLMASWPKTLCFEIEDLGAVLFCHATPRSETEIFTRLTPAERLTPLFDGLGAALVICGHTHMQFDRMIGHTRVVNAGSVGEPFGMTGAYWVLLGPDIQLRRTDYDLTHAAEQMGATFYPQAQEAVDSILNPPAESKILELFSKAEVQ